MDTIVLVHGYPGFVKLGAFEYFNGIAEHLEREFDVKVIAPEIGPVGTIANRSGELEKALDKRFAKSPKPMHIIAHSVGGLDARHLVSRTGRGRADLVATVTTIGTPHKGTSLAELASGMVKLSPLEIAELSAQALREITDITDIEISTEEFKILVEFFVGKKVAGRLGILEAFTEAILDAKGYATRLLNASDLGLQELTRTAMTQRDIELIDNKTVTYASYAGVAGPRETGGLSLVLFPSYLIVRHLEKGESDGWISVASATRNDLTHRIFADHIQQVGQRHAAFGVRSSFDHLSLYADIVMTATGLKRKSTVRKTR